MIRTLVLCAMVLVQEAPDVAVVCPRAFQKELSSWISWREQQGHAIVVVQPAASAMATRERLQAIKSKRLRYLLLVGDAPPVTSGAPTGPIVPTHYRKATVNVRWGSESKIATDQPYADLDGDGVDDLAVGRLPVRSAAELGTVIRKLKKYERSPTGHWAQRLNVVAGVGGFGAMADRAIEMIAKNLLVSMVPASHRIHFTSAHLGSPFCPAPQNFRGHTMARLNEGALYWVYLGHGYRRALDSVRAPSGNYPILRCSDAYHLQCRVGSPIAVMLACYVGAFDSPYDSLSEALIKAPGGPVAVVSGTRVTMPYGNAVFGRELLHAAFEYHPHTIGALILAAKRATLLPLESDDVFRSNLDGMASLVSPPPVDLTAERREHVAMYHLLGDPLLRLPATQNCEIDVATFHRSQGVIEVQGQAPHSGHCVVELADASPRLRGKSQPAADGEQRESQDARYERSNNRIVAKRDEWMNAGPFALELPVPATTAGEHVLRLTIIGDQAMAIGARAVSITPGLRRTATVQQTTSDERTR